MTIPEAILAMREIVQAKRDRVLEERWERCREAWNVRDGPDKLWSLLREYYNLKREWDRLGESLEQASRSVSDSCTLLISDLPEVALIGMLREAE